MNIHAAIELINNEDLIFDHGEWKVQLPDYLVRIGSTGTPSHIYKILVDHYPKVLPYIVRNELLPISMIDVY
jgi:hypothetical protein